MASTTLSKKTEGLCCVSMKYKDREYKNVKLSLLPHMCADVILGHDSLNQHSEVFIPFEGDGLLFQFVVKRLLTLRPIHSSKTSHQTANQSKQNLVGTLQQINCSSNRKFSNP